MNLHKNHVPVFFEFLELSNTEIIKSDNKFNPPYRWVWQGDIYWAYDFGQSLQIKSNVSTDTIKESFMSAIEPSEG